MQKKKKMKLKVNFLFKQNYINESSELKQTSFKSFFQLCEHTKQKNYFQNHIVERIQIENVLTF